MKRIKESPLDRKKNVPKTRFQNYEDEWVYSTIGRHISLLNGRAYKQEELLDDGKYKVLRVGNFNTNSKWYYSNLELEDNKYVNKGELLYLWATNFGPEIWMEEKAIYHYHIWKLEFDKTNINQDYLCIWLESDKNKIQQNTNGSTMVHITKNMMEERRISLPSQDEQSAIGSLFRTLDELIASHKDNLANYQSLKATMLSKMFPKAGQSVPEIRLDGYEGEWGNAIIKDHVTLLNGRAFKQDELLDEGKYRVVRVGNFNTNDKWYYSNLELEENKYAYKGDLLYLWATNFGPEIWDEEKIIFHYHIWKFEFDRSIIDRDYLYYWLERDKERIKQNTNGSTMVHVTKSMMENREFLFPMFREQQAIGTYFSNLDNLINSHQEKISQLETLKKKLLKDMFI